MISGLFLALFLGLSANNPASWNRAQQPSSSPASSSLEERLVTQLNSSDEEVRMDALVQMGTLFSSAPGALADSTLSALTNALQRDPSPVIRALAARALELGGDARVAQYFLAALANEREVAVRKAIAYALARYPSAQVSVALLSLLKDKKHEVRGAAAYSLAELGDPSAAAPLIEVLQKLRKNEDAFTRSQAARALGRVGGRESLEPLLRSLNRDPAENVRREAAYALGQIATKQDLKIIEALREARLSADPYLAQAANLALESITARAE
jgi:HEAT repeat protein